MIISPTIFVCGLLGLPAVGALCAAAGAYLYHCGARGKSPVPALPSFRKEEPAKPEPPRRVTPDLRG